MDFEKAYDKVKWSFLQQSLRMKGFDEAWRRQVDSFTQKGSVGIKVNDHIGHYFQTHKGLRQGDPMSPILFNILVDMLAILIGRAKENGQVGGLIPHLVDGGVSILQYDDDTIFFMELTRTDAVFNRITMVLFMCRRKHSRNDLKLHGDTFLENKKNTCHHLAARVGGAPPTSWAPCYLSDSNSTSIY